MLFRILIVAVFAGLLCSTVALAGDLKVIDSHGLTRAVRVIKEKAQVVIDVSPQPDGPIPLSNIDGIANDVKGIVTTTGQLLYQGVSEGTWQLKPATPVTIKSVKITD